MDVDAATRTMIDNIPQRTGRPVDEWFTLLDGAGLSKHGEMMTYLKREHGMSHGFANLVVTLHRSRGQDTPTGDELVDAQYAGAKAALRPVLDRIVSTALSFGEDVEVAPKKTGVSLRRRKQFALVEVPSAKRVRVGLNLPGREPTGRLVGAGGMCTHRVDVVTEADVDDELIGWLAAAYQLA